MRKGKHSVLVFIWSGWIGTLLSTYKKHKRQAERGWRMRQCHFFFSLLLHYIVVLFTVTFSLTSVFMLCVSVCVKGEDRGTWERKGVKDHQLGFGGGGAGWIFFFFSGKKRTNVFSNYRKWYVNIIRHTFKTLMPLGWGLGFFFVFSSGKTDKYSSVIFLGH